MLEKYLEALESEQETIEAPSKELVEEWLDKSIELWEKAEELKKQCHEMAWGELKDGEYENEIDFISITTACDGYGGYQCYSGIDKLAKILGAPLVKENNDTDAYKYKYWFTHKGFKIYQVGDEEL